MAKTATIHAIEYARTQTQEEYALLLQAISADDLPPGTIAFNHKDLTVNRDTAAPLIWTGDLDDDCSSRWADLFLRAEEMADDDWWWAVTDARLAGAEIGSSNWAGLTCVSGRQAREQAEQCAWKYLEPKVRAW
ncbi:hypothetical protein [Prosthecobacter sp.]|uniref:hypothetical protein n=1 Tax=Prosthecobacter sp. TaxID=1965333 RepID=UPI003784A071